MNTTWHNIRKALHAIYGGPWWQKIIAWISTIVLALLLFLGAVDINFLWLFGRSPGFKDIKHPISSEASILISSDSLPIGKFYNENRTPVTPGKLPTCWLAPVSWLKSVVFPQFWFPA